MHLYIDIYTAIFYSFWNSIQTYLSGEEKYEHTKSNIIHFLEIRKSNVDFHKDPIQYFLYISGRILITCKQDEHKL